MSSVKWWRVVDPLNPLNGCDVRIGRDEDETYFRIATFDDDVGGHAVFASVTAIRRLDVLVGNRPFQLVNPEGDLGILVDKTHLEESPIQDDIVEIEYDRPHGKCLSEEVISTGDGDELRVVDYENAIQIAYGEHEGELYATCTLRGEDRGDRYQRILAMFKSENFEFYSFVARMKQENH